ncbi:hypothetical protein M9H77_17149 [Catharanthus roseus]|uniref:Uncharacterized protein n=1 Tax=Catharanthus roseus TaxID=4058 RepID=A0ACC0B3T8_CATRO|nr:hypothetical protein M9H77_17149 [Catharanthus roseus]
MYFPMFAPAVRPGAKLCRSYIQRFAVLGHKSEHKLVDIHLRLDLITADELPTSAPISDKVLLDMIAREVDREDTDDSSKIGKFCNLSMTVIIDTYYMVVPPIIIPRAKAFLPPFTSSNLLMVIIEFLAKELGFFIEEEEAKRKPMNISFRLRGKKKVLCFILTKVADNKRDSGIGR